MKIIKLQPIVKNYLWGGNRLIKDFSIESCHDLIAEAWLLSCHPDGLSLLETNGHSLRDLLIKYPEYLGTKASQFNEFPILVKLIDAQKNLSIQVHPNDIMAQKLENGLGKSEFWYVLETTPKAFIYLGWKESVSEKVITKSIENGTITDLMNKVYVKPGDYFFVEAGTVHAIGAGVLLAEIQQNSNLTYRLFDYNRVDNHGLKRELHIDQALKVLNFEASLINPSNFVVNNLFHSSFYDLISTPYFSVKQIILNEEVSFSTGSSSFGHLLITDGDGSIINGDEQTNFKKGDSYFLPANGGKYKLKGKAEILITYL